MKCKNKILIVAVSFLLIALINKVSAQVKPKTSHQIKLLLKEKNSRTLIERKIDSRLLQAMREYQGKKMVKGVDLEPANVSADNNGNLKVDINADVNDTVIKKIKSLGASIIFSSKQYHSITALINLSTVEKIAGFSEVKFVSPAAIPVLNEPMRPLNPTPIKQRD